MVTAVLIVLAVLALVAGCCLVNAAINGCPCAWIWLACGGLGHIAEFFAMCCVAIVEGFTGSNN